MKSVVYDLQCEQSHHFANVSSHINLQCQQSHHSQREMHKLFYFQYFHLIMSCGTIFLKKNLQQYSLQKRKISD